MSASNTFGMMFRWLLFFSETSSFEYLGNDMDEVHGSAVYLDAGIELESVPLFPLQSLVLFPMQTLPLNELNPRHVAMLRHLIAHQRIFAVVARRYVDWFKDKWWWCFVRSDASNELASIGTLAQVIAYKQEDDDETVKIRALGRQRCKVLNVRTSIDGCVLIVWMSKSCCLFRSQHARLRILPEISLDDALKCATPYSWLKFVKNKRFQVHRWSFYWFNILQNRYIAAALTPYPAFIYREYDIVCHRSPIKLTHTSSLF